MSKKIIHNVETGEITEIELTPEEILEIETRLQAKLNAEAEAAAARAVLLSKLGITEEEAKLLLS